MFAVAEGRTKARILVIDDDGPVRALIRQMLERDGYDVADAPDGAAGLHEFAACRAHLVVVDIFMPDKSGWETIRALQTMAAGLPFIVVSGGGALEAVQKGSTGTLEAMRGVATYRVLRKPFQWRELRAAVEDLLGGGERPGEPS
jgi:DNA-binding response OmpR family regulator